MDVFIHSITKGINNTACNAPDIRQDGSTYFAQRNDTPLLKNFVDVINDATECRLMTYDTLKIELCKTADVYYTRMPQ